MSGHLKYVTDYTEFSGNPEEQHGNYLALKVGNIPADAVVTYQKVGGSAEPVTLDSDRNIVLIIRDLSSVLRFTATYNGETVTRDLTIAGLVLDPAPAQEDSNTEEVVG